MHNHYSPAASSLLNVFKGNSLSTMLHNTPRLYIAHDFIQNQALTIIGDQAHYLLHVMRLKIGDSLRLFNGHDGEWHGIVKSIAKRSIEINLQDQLKPQKTEPDLWLCCAPIKKAHFEYMIEKATELGVSKIQPVLTSRTQIRQVNIERCASIAIEAAEQSERMSIPTIEKPLTLPVLIKQWASDRILIVCAEFGEAQPVGDAFKALAPSLPNLPKAAIVTGPEGGFIPEELEQLRQQKNTSFIRLGPRILRADTAAISALSCWQALAGDWK